MLCNDVYVIPARIKQLTKKQSGKVKVYYIDDEDKGSLFLQDPPYEVGKGTKYVMLDKDKADEIASEREDWYAYFVAHYNNFKIVKPKNQSK